MKKSLFLLLLIGNVLFFACRNGADKKSDTSEVTISIEQIEKENEVLEKTVTEIESKEAALEAALKELE